MAVCDLSVGGIIYIGCLRAGGWGYDAEGGEMKHTLYWLLMIIVMGLIESL